MNDGPKTAPGPHGPKIVSILRAKRLPYSHRPAIEPPCKVGALTADIPEKDRFLIAEADINADIRIGDLGLTALRKCRYVLENARQAFTDPGLLELMVGRTVRIIAEYGEPEGAPLIRMALDMYLDMPYVREEASAALARVGEEGHLVLLLVILGMDAASPGAHIQPVLDFAERFPAVRWKVIEEIGALQAACPEAAEALARLRRGGK